ncbi:helix-turn-helix domain-containing protein [Stenotrophomonas acidaminiphila]|uniref:helix-turn-helix domain-containing protein n=1 Tax=Stenotrophomonas acidaminiphila TaxID=128780 RepID=UPI001FAF01D4
MSAPTLQLYVDKQALVIGGLDGTVVYLTPGEYAVAAALVGSLGSVVTRQALLSVLYPEREPAQSNTLQVLIYRLRKKLQAAGGAYTVAVARSTGYTLRARGAA